MSLTGFNRLRRMQMQQVEEMKPENIVKEEKIEIKEEPKIEEAKEEIKEENIEAPEEEIKEAEESVRPRRRRTSNN